MAQISETFLPQPLGAFPKARSPLGALAQMVLRAVFAEHPSAKTNLSAAMLLAYSRKDLLRSSHSDDATTLF
jgi:hypothetical protein